MDNEEKKTEEQKPEEAKGLIAEALAAAKRIEEANARTEALIKKQEELIAIQALGGRSSAGQSLPQINEAEEKKKEINRLLASTGLKI